MTLRKGDRGPDVEQLQRRLLAAGFAPGGVDGIYGARTVAAVRDLQESAGLRPDGVFGPRSAEALDAVLAAGAKPYWGCLPGLSGFSCAFDKPERAGSSAAATARGRSSASTASTAC